ncbi:MAG: YIP1 family protein, partial [Paracoccaceae bacterium]
RLLQRGPSEPFAFTLLAIFLLLAFTSKAPSLARTAYEIPQTPMIQLVYGAMLGLLTAIPVLYLLAAIGHLIARAIGGTGGYYGGRLALFWALVCVSPAMLLQGLVAGLIGFGVATIATGLLVAAAFLTFWIVMLREVERG